MTVKPLKLALNTNQLINLCQRYKLKTAEVGAKHQSINLCPYYHNIAGKQLKLALNTNQPINQCMSILSRYSCEIANVGA